MKRTYIRPQVDALSYAPACTLCASGDRHHFGTGGMGNPGGGR